MTDSTKNSIVDELYYKLFGEHQTKEGQALEHLTALAFKVLNEERNVRYDLQMRGKYSKTVYQIDGMLEEGDNQKMVEAKDYSVQGKKVGRADLQKLEGALTDLDIAEGCFVSATDYTNRAKPYAESTKVNPKQNPIDLYHIRPSNKDDEQGRIKTIEVNLIAHGLEFEKGTYIPVFNQEDFKRIEHLVPQNGHQLTLTLYLFYDACGNICDTFENITKQLNSRLPDNFIKGYVMKGEWKFNQPTYIDIPPYGRLCIDSLKYEIPTYTDEMKFTLNQEGEPVLLVKSEDGTINKLITDHQLKSYKFDDGRITK